MFVSFLVEFSTDFICHTAMFWNYSECSRATSTPFACWTSNSPQTTATDLSFFSRWWTYSPFWGSPPQTFWWSCARPRMTSSRTPRTLVKGSTRTKLVTTCPVNLQQSLFSHDRCFHYYLFPGLERVLKITSQTFTPRAKLRKDGKLAAAQNMKKIYSDFIIVLRLKHYTKASLNNLWLRVRKKFYSQACWFLVSIRFYDVVIRYLHPSSCMYCTLCFWSRTNESS